MTLQGGLPAYLLTQTSFTDLVGDRLYFVQADEQSPAPYVVVRFEEADSDHDLAGQSEYLSCDITFDIFATEHAQCWLINSTLRSLLRTFRGTMGDVSVVHFKFDDSHDEPVDAEREIFWVKCIVNCWYRD